MAWYDFSLGQGYTLRNGSGHDGRDVQTPLHTPLTNLIPGTVTPHTGFYPWGGEVDILTASGVTETWAHLDAIAVHPGQQVGSGGFIGLSGGENLPGNYSTGPHTHFSLFSGAPWNNAGAIDPTPLLTFFQGSGPQLPGASNPISGLVWGPAAITAGLANTAGLGALPGNIAGSLLNPDLLWRTGLILLGGFLILAGLIIFIWPKPETVRSAATVAAAVA